MINIKRKTKMNLRQKIVLEDSKAFIPNKSKISRIFSIINKMYLSLFCFYLAVFSKNAK
jgi:hypothetical protein